MSQIEALFFTFLKTYLQLFLCCCFFLLLSSRLNFVVVAAVNPETREFHETFN